jgi:hypothetical protein
MVNFAKMLGLERKSTPSYNVEREAERQRIQGDYDARGSAWNTNTTSFNNALAGLSTNFNDLLSRSRGLNIADQGGIDAFDRDLSSFRSSLSGLSPALDRPTFSPTQTLYGQTVGFNLPTLVDPNTSLFDRLNSDMGGLASSLSGIRTARENEQRRVSDFGTNITSQASNLASLLDSLNIANESGLNTARSNLGGLRTSLSNFTSPLGFTPNFAPGMDLDSLGQRVDGLFQQRGAEQGRISDFESAILGLADNLRSGIQGLGIRDIDRVTALDNQLEEKRRAARRFSSVLPFDLSQELYELDDVDRIIEDIKTRRGNEEARINTARGQFSASADDLIDRASGLDMFSRPQLDAVASALSRTRRDMDRFTSDLDFDFGEANTGLSSAEARLNELLGQRSGALGAASTRAQTLAQGISDIPLQDEAALTGRRNDISSARGDLSRFTGNDVTPVLGEYDNALSAINTRLTELTNRRSDIERQAQQLMERANSSSFYYADDLNAPQTQLDTIRGDADLFAARQALDEIDAITRRLTSERSRMEADAAQVRARQDQERQAMERSNFTTEFGLMTPEQYQNFLVRRRQEDPLFIAASPTSFSSSLGM